MAGFDAAYVPGWDCHGLPIEHNVDKELGDRKKDMSQADIRRQCRVYAEKFIDIQREEFKRLGVMGEWDDPYLTMNYTYEAIIATECLKFALADNLFRSKKPIHWCCQCQTALAEAEIEYHDESSPSVFVKFQLQADLSRDVPGLSGETVSYRDLDHHALDPSGKPGHCPASGFCLRGRQGLGQGRVYSGAGHGGILHENLRHFRLHDSG